MQSDPVVQMTVIQANAALRVLEALAPLAPNYVAEKFITVVVRDLVDGACCARIFPASFNSLPGNPGPVRHSTDDMTLLWP